MELKAKREDHKIGDLVYSNSYGLGWIESIEIVRSRLDARAVFSRFPEGTIVYIVTYDINDPVAPQREYSSIGIDTMKMFLRQKQNGANI